MKRGKTLAALSALLFLFTIGSGVAAAADSFGIAKFGIKYQDPTGAALLQAGSHADVRTEIEFNGRNGFPAGRGEMAGSVRDTEVDLPAGFAGNPTAIAACSQEELIDQSGVCNPAAQVGVLTLETAGNVNEYALYNMEASNEQAAVLAAIVLGVPAKIVVSVRSDGDYGLVARSSNINQGVPLGHLTLTLWGVPYETVHDPLRQISYGIGGAHINAPSKPFLSLPTRCEPMITEIHADSWQDPGARAPSGDADLADPRWVSASSETPPLGGCEKLDFAPTVSARPTTNVSDSPSGLALNLHIPQNANDPESLSPANLRAIGVNLPDGFVVNPAGANGLGACDLTQIGYSGKSNERQFLRFDPNLTQSFTASFDGETTAPIPSTAGSAEVASALESLPGLSGNIHLQRAPSGWIVSFSNSLAGKDVPSIQGVVKDNSSQSLKVTGDGGAFNLHLGGESTAATFEADLPPVGEQLINYTNASRELKEGDPIEGPGIAPGTTILGASATQIFISQGVTEELAGVHLNTALPFNATAATIEEALQAMPSLGKENVIVTQTGTEGISTSFKLLFAGALAGTSPTITETNTLTGAGAGVVLAPEPATDPHALEILTITKAGTPAFDKAKPTCPDPSKIGSVEVVTPAFSDPLQGSVYTMTPYANPFGSLLGVYIVVEGHGIIAKLPAKITADPQTGQLTNTLEESPQLPIEEVRLKVDAGAAAVLRTPSACGNYTTNSTMVPWDSPYTPTVTDKDEWAIAAAPSGGSCAAEPVQPNAPSFQAGSISPISGNYTPFTLKLSRNDGTQQLSGIETTLPPGLLAKLAGTPYCSDAALAAAAQKTGKAEQASPSCPAASRVGSVTVGAGAGPKPFYAPGTAYLAGPYKGAPLSLAVVTPAVAGPFDLGTVVVRNALSVDPITAQVHAISDPFPSILQGIPLDIRSVDLRLDKPEFTKNPTSCDPFAITGAASARSGQSAPVSSRFQVAECGRLKFSPKLALHLKGEAKRSGDPALTATLKAPAGQANIAKTTVILPSSEFIDNEHINSPCTRVQFNANACPKSSILGTAVAYTPLLDKPLRGPVYFRSNGGERELPDLVADLNGQIHVDLVGYIDSIPIKGTEKSRVRTRFASVPDAPVSKFVLKLYGGKRGLLENSVNLCRAEVGPATVQMTAQNAKTLNTETNLGIGCGKGKKQKRK